MTNKLSKLLLPLILLCFGSTYVHAEFVPDFPQGCAFATLGQSLPNTYLGYGRIEWMGSSFAFQYIDPNVPGPFALAEVADNVGLIGQYPGQVSSVDLMDTPRDNYVVAQILDRSSINLNPIVVCISPVFTGRVRSYMTFDNLPFGDDYFYSYRRFRYDDWDNRRWKDWERWERSWRRNWKGRWDDRWKERRERDRRVWEERRRNPNLFDRDKDRDWKRDWRRDIDWKRDRTRDRDQRPNKPLAPKPRPEPIKPGETIRPGQGGGGIQPKPSLRPVERAPLRRPEQPIIRERQREREPERNRDQRQWQQERQRDGQPHKIHLNIDDDKRGSRPKIHLNIDDNNQGQRPRIKLNIDTKNPARPIINKGEEEERTPGHRRGRR